MKNQDKADIKLSELNKDYLLKEGYKYCLIYYLNDLVFGDIDDIKDINKDILLEAYFFNEQKEFHVFEDEDNNDFRLVVTVDDGSDSFTETFELKKRFGNDLTSNKYKTLKVINYLGYEDDGQAYIEYTSLKGVSK